jgi:transcription elongation factor Elf1
MIGAIIFVCIYVAGGQWVLRRFITESTLFKRHHNPYKRTCKRCGQQQVMYDNGGTIGADYHSWWEEAYPIGNDPKCRCKKYSENH